MELLKENPLFGWFHFITLRISSVMYFVFPYGLEIPVPVFESIN